VSGEKGGRLFGNLFEKVGKAQKVLLPRARTTMAEEGDARVVRRLVVRLLWFCRWGGGGLEEKSNHDSGTKT